MRFSAAQSGLLKALTRAAAVVSKSSTTIPILGSVLVEAEGDGLRLTGSDMESEIVAEAPATIIEPGAVALPATKLLDVVRSSSGLVTGELDGVRLRVRSGRARFTIPGLPATDYPHISTAGGTVRFDMPAPELASMIEAVTQAIPRESGRPYLCGAYLHREGDQLHLVGTDTVSLARASCGAPDGSDGASILLPKKALGELSSLLSGVEIVSVEAAAGQARFSVSGAAMCSKLIAYEYPPYQRILAAERGQPITLSAPALIAAAQRACIAAGDDENTIRLSVSPGRMEVSSSDVRGDEAVDELDVQYEGEPFSCALSGHRLVQALRKMKRDDTEARRTVADGLLITSPSDPSVIQMVGLVRNAAARAAA